MTKRSTAKDVAEAAGVSRTTVSFVLNHVPGMRISVETQQRVFEAAQRLNYHPDATARRMVKGLTNTVGFVLRQTPDQVFSDRFLPEVLHGLSKRAAAQGYHILIEPAPPDDPGGYMRLLRERHVDGIVLSGPRFDDLDFLEDYAESAPVVLMGQLPDSNLPFVDVDNIGGARLATQHLLDLGHRHIAFISNATAVYTASAQRLSGYRQALWEAGVNLDESLVRYGDFTAASGESAMDDLLATSKERPTAVFVASDTVAIGALKAIRRAGLSVPHDIALSGFDDVPWSELIDPPLTTVRLPAYGLGWGTADMLIRLINHDESGESSVLLETELIVRKSCGMSILSERR
jgi:LacI family transcriptional regulator